jgi:hypothetical protein
VVPDALQNQTIDLVFDGSNPATPQAVDVTLRLPPDPESPFRKRGIHTSGRFPFLVTDPVATRIRGGACAKRYGADGDTMDLTVAWFAPPENRPVLSYLMAYTESNLPHYGAYMEVTSRHYIGDPVAGTYDLLDLPRMLQPADTPGRGSTFVAQPQAGLDGYDLTVIQPDAPWAVAWVVRSFHQQELSIPAPPAGFDPATEWTWAATGSARYRLAWCTGWGPWFGWEPAGITCAASNAFEGTW